MVRSGYRAAPARPDGVGTYGELHRAFASTPETQGDAHGGLLAPRAPVRLLGPRTPLLGRGPGAPPRQAPQGVRRRREHDTREARQGPKRRRLRCDQPAPEEPGLPPVRPRPPLDVLGE